jgi:DNA-binding MarR family transcriptional regulator
VSNYWQREIRKSLSGFDLTHTQFVVLANIYFLGSAQKDVTQTDIANHIGIDKMLTSNVLKGLLKKNLVGRTEHETDTRAKVISLTSTGEEVLKQAVQAVEDFDQSFFDKLADQETFNAELLRLLG